MTPVWFTKTATHAIEAPSRGNRLFDVLFEMLAKTAGEPVAILFADPETPDQRLIRRALFPFDFTRFPALQGDLPLTTMPAGALAQDLVEEYVFTELCEALMVGFAAEDAARAAAMSRAQTNVKRIATDLPGQFQRSRQEQMTTEVIELSTAATGQGV